MKGKELIKQLQEIDPTGEIEVSIGNHDIFSVHCEPAYWDGKLQLLIRDEAKKPYFDVIGAKYVVSGDKIVLTSMGVADVLWGDADAIVDYSEIDRGTPHASERYRAADEKTREASRNVVLKVEKDGFYRWVKEKAEKIHEGEDCRESSDYFYDHNLTPDDPVKDLPKKSQTSGGETYEVWPSWSERRAAMWDDTLEVYWEGGWSIRKKEKGEATNAVD